MVEVVCLVDDDQNRFDYVMGLRIGVSETSPTTQEEGRRRASRVRWETWGEALLQQAPTFVWGLLDLDVAGFDIEHDVTDGIQLAVAVSGEWESGGGHQCSGGGV